MAADVNEIEKYWIVKNGIMKDPNVGWYYQGTWQITHPNDWEMLNEPYYKYSIISLLFEPVAGLTRFESNVFCSWMQGSLPTYNQLISCFSPEFGNNSAKREIIAKVHNVNSGTAEWTCGSIPATGPSCGKCNEIRLLENGDDCTLFCDENLGFRLVLPYED